jgi:ATP-dependent protease ClpP protease subunit
MKKPITHNHRKRPFFAADMRQDGTLELLCYELIGEDVWTGDGVTAKLVKQQLDQAPQCSDILLRINSPGGDVFEAIAIVNLLRSQKKPIEVRVDGLAASAASIIAMAGDKIIMAPNAMMMIHNAWTFCVGEAAELRRTADELEKISGVIAGTYVRRTKHQLSEITAMMDAETWMTADEALTGGFATEVEAEPDEQVEQNALAVAKRFRSLARFSRVPERYRAALEAQCECSCQACKDAHCDECGNVDCEDENCVDCPMQNLEELEAKLDGLDLALRV